MKFLLASLFLFLMCIGKSVHAQQDTAAVRTVDTVRMADSIQDLTIAAETFDTTTVTRHSPRKAAIRSAILPGWGQIYNGKIWKLPIVYAAIGIPIGTIVFNKNWYDRTREAAVMLGTNDTVNFRNRVHPQLHFFFTSPNSLQRLLNYRNEFRRNMDYSVLITLLFWGLNVVDATVDAHLKEFDVSDDIGLRIKPVLMPMTNAPGVSFVFTLGRNSPKEIKPLPF